MDIMKDWYDIMYAYAHENWKSFDVLLFNCIIYFVYQIHILTIFANIVNAWLDVRSQHCGYKHLNCIVVLLFWIKVMNKLFSESNVTS
jgi:hypothetical protein